MDLIKWLWQSLLALSRSPMASNFQIHMSQNISKMYYVHCICPSSAVITIGNPLVFDSAKVTEGLLAGPERESAKT